MSLSSSHNFVLDAFSQRVSEYLFFHRTSHNTHLKQIPVYFHSIVLNYKRWSLCAWLETCLRFSFLGTSLDSVTWAKNIVRGTVHFSCQPGPCVTFCLHSITINAYKELLMIDSFIFQTYFRSKAHVVDVPIEAPPATRIEGKWNFVVFIGWARTGWKAGAGRVRYYCVRVLNIFCAAT